MKMNAVRFYAPENIKYEETEIKDPKNGEVRVKIEAALTCGTDLKTYRRGHPVLIKKTPSGFGHEFAGVVEAVGKNVTNFTVGDRVVAANSAPCGECYFCKRGLYNLCENLEFLNGAYAEYINVPERIVKKNMIRIDDELSFEKAAFCEPLANVVHGIANMDIQKGQTAAVVGIGTIGLMFVRLAKLKGAKVIAAGRNPLKIKLAKEFGGADEVIDLTKYKNPDKILLSLTEEGKGFDAAIECVGLPEIWERMFKLVRKGGMINLFGGCKSGTTINIDTRRLHYDELKVIGVFHHTPQYFREAYELIASAQIDVEKLITHVMPLSQTEQALKMVAESQAIKVLLKP